MGLALEEPDFGGFGSSGARGDFSTAWERFTADRRAQVLANNVESGLRAREEVYDRRIDDVFQATGIRLENPARRGGFGRVGGIGLALLQYQRGRLISEDYFDAELKRLAEQYPDAAEIIRPFMSPREEARRLAREAETRSIDLATRDGTWSGALSGLAGSFVGSLDDPVTVMVSLIGDPGGGRSLLVHALRAAVINAGSEAALQPFVQAWRAEAGLPYGVGHAALNIATTAAFGAGIDAAGRAAFRGARVLRGGEWIEARAPETALDEAALRLPRTNPVRQAYQGDAQALADVLETADDASLRELAKNAKDDGLFQKYGIEDDWSHRENIAQALRRAEAPDVEPPPGRARPEAPEARTPDLTDEAPAPGRHFEVEGKPVAFRQVPADRLAVDPGTFQFKGGGDAAGVTSRMSGVGQWDDLAAGKVVVFERADGSQVIADGHQRLGLAKRIAAETGDAPRLDAYVFREADGWDAADVRAIAAKKNLQEGSGDVIDAAKIMRERPDIVDKSVPMSSGMMRTARSLTRLSDEAFAAVVAGRVAPNYGALVADLVPDQARHLATIDDLAALAPENTGQARIAIGQIAAAPARVETQLTLLGAETVTRTLMRERVRVLDAAIKHLRADQRVFRTLNREADRIEAAGNRLAKGVNATLADDASQVQELIATLALSSGRVSDLLNDAAESVAGGTSARMAGEAFARRVGDILERDGVAGLVTPDAPPRRGGEGFDEPGGEDAVRQLEDLEAAREARDRQPGQGFLFDSNVTRADLAAGNVTSIEAIPADANAPHPGLVVAYHGTAAEDFDKFDVAKSEDIGIHFGSAAQANDRIINDDYGPTRVIPVVLDVKNPMTFRDLGTWEPREIYNHLVDQGISFSKAEARLAQTKSMSGRAAEAYELLRKKIAAAGYDAIRYLNEEEGAPRVQGADGDQVSTSGWSYIVWEKGSVRSALTDQRMFAMRDITPNTNRLTPAAAEAMPEIRAELDKIIARLPDDVRLEVQDRIVFPLSDGRRVELDGFFDARNGLIKVALDSADPAATARHEEIHALRHTGLIGAHEWDTLRQWVRDTDVRSQFDIEGKYRELYGKKARDDAHLEDMLDEEAVAHAFEAWSRGKPVENMGAIARVFERLRKFLSEVAEMLGARGFRTADDIFGAIEAGDIGARGRIDAEISRADMDRTAAEVVEACKA